MLEFLVDNISLGFVLGKGLPADSRHANGFKLRPSPSRHLPLLIRTEFIQSLQSAGNSRFNFTYMYNVGNNLGQMYSVELQSKTRPTAILYFLSF